MDPDRSDRRPLTRCALLLGAALVACLAQPRRAVAQTADDYWRDLRAESATERVLAAHAPASVPAPIADGLRLFRAYEVSGDENAARRARELLRRARVPSEHRPWHALALAMVYGRGPDSRLRIDDGAYITDPNSLGSIRSLRLLRSAIETRPGFREAEMELARWALDREHAPVAAEAEVALADLPEDAEVLLTRASLNLLLGQPSIAAGLAARALALGADSGVARHTRAWALFQSEDRTHDGVRLYYLGADRPTEAGRREYARYLEPILSDDELEEWRALPDQRIGDWLREYWARNAARAGVMPDERLVEHYRRLQRARVEFPNVAPLSVLQQQMRFIIGEGGRRFGLSLHGLMLVRHGDPYRLRAIEQCAADPWPADGAMQTICAGLDGSRTALFRAMGRLARGDSYVPFTRRLELYPGVYAFRGPGGTNDVVFGVGLPTRSAGALIDGDRLAGVLSTVLLADSGQFIRRDSVFDVPVPRYLDPLGGELESVLLVFGVLRAPAVDAAREYRVTVSDPERHAGAIERGTVRTHAFRGFSVSDVVVAPETMPERWARGAAAVAFAPLATYRPGETVSVYYEVYGLSDGAEYETEIELAPPAEGLTERLLDLVRDRSVRFRFRGTAARPHEVYGVQEDRTLRLDGVEPGMWTLRVRVTDVATGRAAEREAPIEIEEDRD